MLCKSGLLPADGNEVTNRHKVLPGAASNSRAQVTGCLQVVDQLGEEHEVLLRHWTSSTGLRMYMLERARPLLEAGSAREGFKLQLQHEEGQPMVSTGRGLVKNRAMLLRISCSIETCRRVPAVSWQTLDAPSCVAAWSLQPKEEHPA